MYIPERTESRDSDSYTPMFIAELFTIAKRWKQPKCSLMDEWINKIRYIHTMKYYSALKRNEILIRATAWINLEDMLNKISQTQRGKNCVIPLT